jgi:hypothetical protein
MSTLCVGVTVGAKAPPWELVEVLHARHFFRERFVASIAEAA